MSDQNTSFDPAGVGIKNGKIFGFPYSVEDADLVIIPVPWDVTTSYRAGTSNAPSAILEASVQLDFVDFYVENAWKNKIAMLSIPDKIIKENLKMREKAAQHIAFLEDGGTTSSDTDQLALVEEINSSCQSINDWLFHISLEQMEKGKKVCVLGGDHSSPLAFMKALASREKSFGILHIDAHADLRIAYEDFEFSHASIMHNALKIEQVEKLVQVGIRDLSPDEKKRIEEDERIKTFYDHELKRSNFQGKNWEKQCQEIISELPDKIYISFDIDGLDPKLCPNTGTPVPGGLDMEEVFYLIHQMLESGKQIVGFDLCEVNPSGQNDWNENVGARVLYKLSSLFLKK